MSSDCERIKEEIGEYCQIKGITDSDMEKEFLKALDEYHEKFGVNFDADSNDILEKVSGRSFSDYILILVGSRF